MGYKIKHIEVEPLSNEDKVVMRYLQLWKALGLPREDQLMHAASLLMADLLSDEVAVQLRQVIKYTLYNGCYVLKP